MRLDVLLFEKGLFKSRNKAGEAIRRGDVTVSGKLILKPSFGVTGEEEVSISDGADFFVSNGGYKLQKAVDDFSLNFNDAVCLDVGASTGGFTDCLLRHGAKRVFALDVGESLLDDDLKRDERVKVIDNFNARNLTSDVLGELVDAVVCDVSFISLTYILKPIYEVLKSGGFAVALIKPQFECGAKQLNKNGIVTDKKVRISAIEKVDAFARAIGFSPTAVTHAPVKDDKNVEYLIKLNKGGDCGNLDFSKLP